MSSFVFRTIFKCSLSALLLCGVLCGRTLGQGPAPSNIPVKPELLPSAPPVAIATSPAPNEHRFWDRENRVLFATVAVLDATDFAVTHANLQSGGRELNPFARTFGSSTTGLAVNFTGETAGVIGISYILHKTGHHKLERVVSMANIGASAAAVTYGFAHR